MKPPLQRASGELFRGSLEIGGHDDDDYRANETA